ncbi:diacylglycerol/lipid kinase family protein [Alkaliphilus peptidifermentans]|uniref:Lipid kinase, YegS/Rv2252/BmrU family n=1 Tax=Alkaliphilus peptidifermentans DSM 18978 TaxID=1120976 RepID=A0A1G5HFX3_9FIRM|nr:diacylglycerol kinase family protein [Alkaliphilus peptidifermentans]SCY62624.1 lipid kinase, YegS/Rv2252/BmrU family [Alkaliphilus peptidifermentans DSM 18978]
MEDKTYLFIVNPISGNGKGSRMVGKIHEVMKDKKTVYRLEVTKAKGNAKEIAMNASEDIIVAVGGDGTINEVVNGIAQKKKVLGVIPSGTGNDFIRNLNIPVEADKAIEIILKGKEKEINIGKVFEHYFINIASVGLDAQIASEANTLKKHFNGTYAYIAALIKVLFSFRYMKLVIKNSDKTYVLDTMLMAFCNGRSYGGGMKIAPEADMSDDLMDICIVKKMSKLKLLILFPTIFKGKHLRFNEVEMMKTSKITLFIKDPLKINLDGEIFTISKEEYEFIDFKIFDHKIKVLC